MGSDFLWGVTALDVDKRMLKFEVEIYIAINHRVMIMQSLELLAEERVVEEDRD